MKILLTNNHMKDMAGTETWTYAMARELSSQGHEIEVFTFKPGFVSDKIREFGKVTDKPATYDLAIINHNTCLDYLKHRDFPKIFTCHGINKKNMEMPLEGADSYVSISEEVQFTLHKFGFHSTIIRNGVDCDRFRPLSDINTRPRQALVLSKRLPTDIFRIIADSCRKMSINLKLISSDNTSWNIEDEINNADIVFSMGRGCYEAMACARNVIIYDSFGADGYVDGENIFEFRKCNCSGRRYRRKLTVDSLTSEIGKYSVSQGLNNREYILQHNNIRQTSRQYVNLLKAGGNECPFTISEHDDAIKELNRIIVQKDRQISELESRFTNTKPLKKFKRALRDNLIQPIKKLF